MDRAGLVLFVIAAIVFFNGCARHRPDVMADPDTRLAALEGYDIPLAEITEGRAFVEPRPEDALILKNVHFDFDDSSIRDDAKPVLEGIAAWMTNNPRAELMIEGHCDERGTREYNLALGERRALSVRSHLIGLGVSERRLHTISYGKEKPLCLESNEACWQRNRRAQFRVSYGTDRDRRAELPPPPAEVRRQIDREVVREERVSLPRDEEAPRGRAIHRYYQ